MYTVEALLSDVRRPSSSVNRLPPFRACKYPRIVEFIVRRISCRPIRRKSDYDPADDYSAVDYACATHSAYPGHSDKQRNVLAIIDFVELYFDAWRNIHLRLEQVASGYTKSRESQTRYLLC